jgi:hypothetical protein
VKDGKGQRLTDGTIIILTEDHVFGDLGDEAVVMNIATGIYFGLDKVAMEIWKCLQQQRTFKELKEMLLLQFEVESDRCDTDLRNFLQQLCEQKLVSFDYGNND